MTKVVAPEEIQVNVTLRHSHNHSNIEEYARESVLSLTKVFAGIINAHVILDHQNNDFEKNKLAEITVHVPQHVFVGKEAATTYEQAIDACIEALSRQLVRHKEKMQ